jgi:hypothetical protein
VSGEPGVTSEAHCPTGKVVIGGGFDLAGHNGSEIVHVNRPIDEDTWAAHVSGSASVTVTAYAICATPAGP